MRPTRWSYRGRAADGTAMMPFGFMARTVSETLLASPAARRKGIVDDDGEIDRPTSSRKQLTALAIWIAFVDGGFIITFDRGLHR